MAWTSSNRRAQLPADWRPTRRPRILARDGYRCVARMQDGSRCTETTNLEVDHIGDRHDHSDENLQVLCSWHHKQKTANESSRARQRKPPERRGRPAEAHPGLT